jgi:hypothetical protein
LLLFRRREVRRLLFKFYTLGRCKLKVGVDEFLDQRPLRIGQRHPQHRATGLSLSANSIQSRRLSWIARPNG